MTRHGTLAYYLSAWIIGCPTVALVFWVIQSARSQSASSSALLEVCFFSLTFGVLDSLLFAFLLRRTMHLLGSRNVAIWALAGAVLWLALLSPLAWMSDRLPQALHQPFYFLTAYLCWGPRAVWAVGWWQAPMEGAAVGAVLSLIDRAFNPAPATFASVPGEHEPAPTR